MAGPTVTLAFAGDSSALEKTFNNVGGAADKMAGDVGGASKRMAKDAEKSFDGLRDHADNNERRFIGLSDAIGGTGDVMQGFKDGNVAQMAMGFADLAGSVANLGADLLEWGKKALEAGASVAKSFAMTTASRIKDTAAAVASKAAALAAAAASGVVTAAQWALNAAMSANPIMLVVLGIGALVAAFVLAWQHSETFRNIVTGAFNAVKDAALFVFNWVKDHWPLLLAIITGPIGLAVLAVVKHWDTIKSSASAAWNFVKDAVTGVASWIFDRWNDVINFVTGLPGRIASAAAGMWNGITSAFKGAINKILDVWNSIEFKIPGFKIGPIGYDGFTLGLPDIPHFSQGGITSRDMVGQLHANEAVIPLHKLASVVGSLNVQPQPVPAQDNRSYSFQITTNEVDAETLMRRAAWEAKVRG